MLYLTTRSSADAFTPFRTLQQGRGPEGGFFIPMNLPRMEPERIEQMLSHSFSQNIADILNLFFNARMDSWDVDFCIGRYSSKVVPMSHRIMVAETWHNPDYDFSRIVRNLSSRIQGSGDTTGIPTDWAWITVRIATLFGLFSEIYRSSAVIPGQRIDIAIPSGDFAGPMAAWYAREMGLPIGCIVCACDENDAVWDLLHYGEILISKETQIPPDLERLICGSLGREEVCRFVACVNERRPYQVPEGQLDAFSDGLYAAVISWKRREQIISSVYKTSTYILDPGSAMAYGGLQDYRAGSGESRTAVIVTERSPILSAGTVAQAMDISVDELNERMKRA